MSDKKQNSPVVSRDMLVPILIVIVVALILYKFGILANLPVIGDFFKKTSTVLIIGNKDDPTYVTVYNYLSELKLNDPINIVELDPNKVSSVFDPKILEKADLIVLAYQGDYPRVLLDALSKVDKNLIVIGNAGKIVKDDSSSDGWILMNFDLVKCGSGTSSKCDYDKVKLGDLYFVPTDIDNPILKRTFGLEYRSEIPSCDKNDPNCNDVIKIYKVGGNNGNVLLKVLEKLSSQETPYDVLFVKKGVTSEEYYFAYMNDDPKTGRLFKYTVESILNYL